MARPRRGAAKIGRNGKPTRSNSTAEGPPAKKSSGSGDSPDASRSPSPAQASTCRPTDGVTLLEAPTKGVIDNNEYRAFQMHNGIRVLLISDQNSKSTPEWHHRPNLRHAFRSFASPMLPFPSTGTSNWAMPSQRDTAQTPLFSSFLHQTEGHSWFDSNFANFLPMIPSTLAPQGGILCGEIDRRSDLECGGDGSEGRTVDEEHKFQGACDLPLEASIAITVNAGAGDDPDTHPGMAHFCEHMVHYGSPKYPKEDMNLGFFISEGASMNAFTQNQTTTYTFSINPDHLEEGMERMSDMLAFPLFKTDVVRREVQSVDNEFLLKKHNDSWKRISMLGSVPENHHPLHTFSCGNAETLLHLEEKGKETGVRDLEDALRLFHKKYYVGSAMTLTLQCPAPLDIMQKLVVEHFSEIPKGDRNIRQFSEVKNTPTSAYHSSEFNRIYAFESSTFTTYMVIAWAFGPDAHKDWQGRPIELLEAIFNEESNGSLLHWLRSKNYITDAYAAVPYYEAFRNDYFTLFELTLFLTEEGLKDYDEVLEAVFGYIERVKITPCGDVHRLHGEMAASSTKLFDYSGAGESSSLTIQCSLLQQYLPAKDIFKFDDCSESAFNEKTFRRYLEDLSPKKMNVTLHVSGDFYEDLKWEEFKDTYYETDYKVSCFPKTLITRLENVKPVSSVTRFPRNPFVSTCRFVPDRGNVKGQTIDRTGKALVCHRGHIEKTVYRASCFVCFRFPFGNNGLRNSVLVSILSASIGLRTVQTTSLVRRSGTQVRFGVNHNNIVFEFCGFPESLPFAIREVLRDAVDRTVAEPISRETFNMAKTSLLMALRRMSCNYSVQIQALIQLMVMETQSEEEHVRMLTSIKYEELLPFSNLYFSSSYCWVEIRGNASENDAWTISRYINSLNFSSSIGYISMPVKPDTIVLPHGDRCIRMISGNSVEVSSSVLNLYQLGFSQNLRAKEMAVFLGSCMESSCFSILRTEKQLGYTVQAFPITAFRAAYIGIILNYPAAKNTACAIDKEMDNFLKLYYLRHLSTMSLQDFEYQSKRLNLSSKLSLSDIVTWYKRNLLEAVSSTSGEWNDTTGCLSKLSIQVLAYDEKTGKSEESCPGIARCENSQWNGLSDSDFQLYFASDNEKSAVPYFIDEIQKFRNELAR